MLDQAHAERARLRDRIREVDKLIALLQSMDDRSEVAPELLIPRTDGPELEGLEPTYPKPRDAILMVMEAKPGKLFAPKDVTNLVKQLGFYNAALQSGPTAYSTALSRLADEDDSPVKRHSSGAYYFAVAPEEKRGASTAEEVSTS